MPAAGSPPCGLGADPPARRVFGRPHNPVQAASSPERDWPNRRSRVPHNRLFAPLSPTAQPPKPVARSRSGRWRAADARRVRAGGARTTGDRAQFEHVLGPVGSAPRTKSPVPLKPAPSSDCEQLGAGQRCLGHCAGGADTASGRQRAHADRRRLASSFRTISPTNVGGPALGLTDLAASRAATITATSRRTPTPPPQPKLSLDDAAGPAPGAPASAEAPAST